MLLRFYTERGRFPRGRGEFPDAAVDYVARQVGLPATELAFYEWSGRTIEFHRRQIRHALGFRECGVADADKLTEWLICNVTQVERGSDQVREELLARCLAERTEPPTAGRVDRIVRSALHRGEEMLVGRVVARLPLALRSRLLDLIAADGGGDELDGGTGAAELASIRSEPGNVSLNTMLTEIATLQAVRTMGLPADVFADVAPKVVAGWRARAAVEAPSHLRQHAQQVTVTLLGALLYCREREITDTLVELLISTVHRINARAEVRVTKEQAALVYVNTLMIQDLLADPEWAEILTDEDRRGLTPLFWAHVLPYGEVKLNMGRRLNLCAV